MHKVLADNDELYARVYQFPTSAVKLNGRKINYYDFLTGKHPDECSLALTRIVPRIDLPTIAAFIDGVPLIPDIQKSFYKLYLDARYNQILLPAFELSVKE